VGAYPARCGACAQGGAVALTNRGAYARPRHNRTENALIANMRNDSNIPWLNSLAAMRHYARQRWHDPAVTIAHCWAMAAVVDAGATTIPKGTAAA
jgi:hypothetical protein